MYQLDPTPHELLTLGFVACTILSYMSWWAEPLEVDTSTALTVDSQQNLSKLALLAPLEVYRLKGEATSEFEQWFDTLEAFMPRSLRSLIPEQRAIHFFGVERKPRSGWKGKIRARLISCVYLAAVSLTHAARSREDTALKKDSMAIRMDFVNIMAR